MNRYRVTFHFGGPENTTQIIEAESKEEALTKIPGEGSYNFTDSTGVLFSIQIERVNYISVSEFKQPRAASSSNGWR